MDDLDAWSQGFYAADGSASPAASPSGSPAMSPQVTNGLFGLANTWLKADTMVKLQRGANGYPYLEGQRMPGRPTSVLSIPTDLLVMIGIGALFFFAKD